MPPSCSGPLSSGIPPVLIVPVAVLGEVETSSVPGGLLSLAVPRWVGEEEFRVLGRDTLLQVGFTVERVCQMVLVDSNRASLIGRAILAGTSECRMSKSLCWGSLISSRGIFRETATCLTKSWNCQKSSATNGEGEIKASSGEEDKMVV